jgi:predicted peptidase
MEPDAREATMQAARTLGAQREPGRAIFRDVLPRPLTFVAADGTRLPYLLHLPPGHAAPRAGAARRRWPVILFLHGAGERGSDPTKLLRTGLPARLTQRPDVPAIVVGAPCGADATLLANREFLL